VKAPVPGGLEPVPEPVVPGSTALVECGTGTGTGGGGAIGLPSGTATPRPTRLARPLEHDEVEQHQPRPCAHRPTCLRTAAAANWRGMSCQACTGQRPPAADDLAAERHGLAAMGEALALYHLGRGPRGAKFRPHDDDADAADGDEP